MNIKVVDHMSRLAKFFEGTHNFHNYSKGASPHNNSSKRYIIKMAVDLLDNNELESLSGFKPEQRYVKVSLNGQSFVYHQIRKMIGMLVQSCQEDLDETLLENSLCANKVSIWLAPSEGLLLDRLNFQHYNKKNDILEKLELSEDEAENARIFKNKHIYRSVLESEEKNSIFTNWSLDIFRYK